VCSLRFNISIVFVFLRSADSRSNLAQSAVRTPIKGMFYSSQITQYAQVKYLDLTKEKAEYLWGAIQSSSDVGNC